MVLPQNESYSNGIITTYFLFSSALRLPSLSKFTLGIPDTQAISCNVFHYCSSWLICMSLIIIIFITKRGYSGNQEYKKMQQKCDW